MKTINNTKEQDENLYLIFSLMMNPPYLAPKGCFKGEQIVRPGKIIEYDSALMPQAPTPLNFDNALHGWDFLNYFKTTTESATGIYNIYNLKYKEGTSRIDLPTYQQIKQSKDKKFLMHPLDAASYLVDYYWPIKL